jgi:hypothetical protein
MRAGLAGVLVLICQLHLSSQGSSSDRLLTLSEYSADLDRLATALGSTPANEAGALAATVPLRWHVAHAGQQIDVDGTWLIHALREASTAPDRWLQTRERLKRRLVEMRRHAASIAESETLTAARREVRRAANDVLARPEFRRNQSPGWFERVQEQIVEWLRRMFERLGADRFARRETAIIFAWIAAIAAVAGLGIWLARMLTASSGAARFGFAHGIPRRVSSREWAMRASSALRAGDIREAVRCAYNGAIHRVEEEGTWRLDESRTPREYLHMLKPDDARRLPVQDLTEQFEQIWYGNRAVEEQDGRRVGVNLEKLGCLSAAERGI